MRSLLVILAMVSTASAGPIDFDFHHRGPLEDILERGRIDLFAPTSPRIIDVHRMHASDCRLDLQHGGACVLRFDVEPIDLAHESRQRALRYRFELLEEIIDTAELAD